MSIKETVCKTRSYRRFSQEPFNQEQFEELISLARATGSGRNCQPWQYALINTPESCEKVFPYLGWAGYLSDWKGPVDGEKPVAYIICTLNHDWLKGSEKDAAFDLGMTTQSILLGATEMGFGGCRIGAFSPKVKEIFTLEENQTIEMIIALGKPAEKVEMVDMQDDDIKYYRDAQDTHLVPKRALSDMIIRL